MESTAALIPFDRLFKFSAAELNDEYRVNLFKKVKEENAELLGMFGDETKEAESEAEAEDSEKDNEEPSEEQSDEQCEEQSDKHSSKQSDKQSKKKSKKVSRKMRELEYDYDDPFIDDSEITDVYQSVFELMRGGGGDYERDEASEDEKDEKSTVPKMSAKKERNFFVYRGTMTPEILAKEFEIDVEELFEAEEGEAEERNVDEGEDRAGEKRAKKRKVNSASDGASASKKVKAAKPAKPLKPAKPAKPVKEAKAAGKKKPGDLIAQSAKKFNDLFSSEEANEKSVVVFNVSGVDANLLELREVLKRFRDLAVGTPFSPGKFPSSLRPRLNETICAVLRLCRPSPTALFPAKLFPALASFLPFSPAALNKLITRKILGPLMEGIEKNEVPKMYETWRKMVERRIMEGGFIEVPKTAVEPANVPTAATDIDNDTVGLVSAVDSQTGTQANAQTTGPTSPMKRRLKFSDEMRQQVFEIIRLETDLNNLICLSNFLEAAASTENAGNAVIRSVQSELNLRKNVYQKLVNLSTETMESGAMPLLSTTEISKEFGAQKRKHEKKVSKAASEILFGEAEVEEMLKELDVRKETQTVVTESVVSVAVESQADPLNLFAAEDQSNTSLFIESNNQ